MLEVRGANVISLLYLLGLILRVSSGYVEHLIESGTICHPFSTSYSIPFSPKDSTKLSDDEAMVVKPTVTIEPWPLADKSCKFTVKTRQPRHTGLFAVVQKMSLRRNGSGCMDWVQFKEDGRKSKSFCGKFDYNDGMPQSQSVFDDGTQVPSSRPEVESDRGEIETSIFISKERLQPGETLDLLIVYTPFKDCEDVKDWSKHPATDDKCIWKEFYCDEYKNCALDSCRDQADCKIVSDGTGTKVTVGAVTTLFLSFLLFVMCLWTCRKHKKLCWSPDCAGPNVGVGNSQPMDMGPRSVVPTVPMLDEVSTRPVHDKDLPPSYNSLFPDQVDPPAT